jgi:4-amino-4-deoxy-L-arabinose transferase-like glycosyltransferase
MPTDDLPSARRLGRWALLAALALAALLETFVAARSPIIAPDGIVFIGMAHQLVDDPQQAIRIQAQHPGYPYLVAGALRVWAVFGLPMTIESEVWAARIPSMIAGVLSVGALWLLARRMFDEQIAGVAAVLFAFLPLARQNAADALSDAPHLCCYLFAAWAALAGLQSRRPAWFALAGLTSAAGFWIRPEGGSVALVVAALLLWKIVQGAPGERLRWAMSLATLVIVTTTVAAPYAILSGRLTDKLRHKPNLRPTPANVESFAPAAVRTGRSGSWVLATISPTAGIVTAEALARAGAELAEQYVSQLNLLLPLVVLGLCWRRSPPPLPEASLTVQSLAWFHVSLLILLFLIGGYIDRRHVLPLAALAMPWGAAGLFAVSEAVAQDRRFGGLRRVRFGLACGMVLILAGAWLPRSLRPLHEPYQPQLVAAHWIRAHAEPGDPLISNSPYIAFYTQHQTEVFGWPDYGAPPPLAERVRDETARYIVLDTGASEHYDPAWLDCLKTQYSLAYRVEGAGRARRHTVLIYELTRLAAKPASSSTT